MSFRTHRRCVRVLRVGIVGTLVAVCGCTQMLWPAGAGLTTNRPPIAASADKGAKSKMEATSQSAPATEALPSPPPETPALDALAVPSEADRNMTVADVLQYALGHHPALQMRQHEVAVAEAKVITARLLPNPQVVLDTDSDVENGGAARIQGRMTLTLPTIPKRRLRTAVAETGVVESRLVLEREVRLVLTEAADAAVELLYWQELLNLERRLSELAARTAKIQEERFKIAAVPYRNRVTADLAVADARLAERAAAARLEVARLRLAQSMGMTAPSAPALCGTLTAESFHSVPLEAVVTRARRVAPELAQSRAAVTSSQRQNTLERWNAVPDVTFGPIFRDSITENDDRVGARLGVDLPIFDRNQGNIAASAAQINSNRARSEVVEINTLSDVAAAYSELQAVQGDLDYYSKEILPLVERTEAEIQGALEDSAVDAYEVVVLLQQFDRTRRSHLDLRRRFNLLRFRLEIVLGCPLSELEGTHSAD
jgi:outer membrane protein, heavy metal efflux system